MKKNSKKPLSAGIPPEKRVKSDTLTVVFFCFLLFGFALAGILVPDRDFSENENRTLASFPTLSDLKDGTFTSDFSSYLSDQFPLRDLCVTVRAGAEALLGKSENNGVIAGKDDYVFAREDYPDTDALETNLERIGRFAAYAKEKGIPTVLAVAGRKLDVETDKLPALYGTDTQERLWEAIESGTEGASYRFLNLRKLLQNDTSGRQLYYRTDHHWTSYGAYTAYRACSMLLPLSDTKDFSFFTEEAVAEGSFYGTTWSKAGMSWKKGDDMVYLRWDGDENVTVTYVGESKEQTGLYDRTYLEKKDKYASFLSGNHGYLQIRTEGSEAAYRGRLLVIKDSFAHSVIPMLASDYDMDVLDLRYYKNIPAKLLAEGAYDAVLILCSADLLTDESNFALIDAGI